MARWKVIRGVHYDPNAVTVELAVPPTEADADGLKRPFDKKQLDEYAKGHNKTKRYVQQPDGTTKEEIVPDAYYPGDVFDSDKDLDHLNKPGSVRFQRLDTGPMDKFDGMTVQQLKEYAAAEEIEVPEKGPKQKIIDAIRASIAYAEAMS